MAVKEALTLRQPAAAMVVAMLEIQVAEVVMVPTKVHGHEQVLVLAVTLVMVLIQEIQPAQQQPQDRVVVVLADIIQVPLVYQQAVV